MSNQHFWVSLFLAIAIIGIALVMHVTTSSVPEFLLILVAPAATWLLGLFTPSPNGSKSGPGAS